MIFKISKKKEEHKKKRFAIELGRRGGIRFIGFVEARNIYELLHEIYELRNKVIDKDRYRRIHITDLETGRKVIIRNKEDIGVRTLHILKKLFS